MGMILHGYPKLNPGAGNPGYPNDNAMSQGEACKKTKGQSR